MAKILFVCSANRFRSVIAAGYFSFLLSTRGIDGEWQVESAGTWAIEGLSPVEDAVRFCKANGFSIEKVRSREVNHDLMQGADLIVLMTEGHEEALELEFPQFRDKMHLLSEVCDDRRYDIPDLGENEDETVEDLGIEICALIDKGFENICIMAGMR